MYHTAVTLTRLTHRRRIGVTIVIIITPITILPIAITIIIAVVIIFVTRFALGLAAKKPTAFSAKGTVASGGFGLSSCVGCVGFQLLLLLGDVDARDNLRDDGQPRIDAGCVETV